MNINQVKVKNLTQEDYPELIESMKKAYPNWAGNLWSEKTINTLLQRFPEGQFVAIADDKVVGCALSIIVDYSKFKNSHTYAQIVGNYTFSTHTYDGDTLYGIEIFIHPDYRGLRLGRRLYDARKELCEKLNLKSIIFGGRIPSYQKYVADLKPKEYIQKVKQKEIYDPVLSFQLSNDFHVLKVLQNYMPEDVQSKEYATLLEWVNVYYEPKLETHSSKTVVRLGLVQWQMRLFKNLEEFYAQARFFVDAVSAYHSDFVVFPEFFNAPLMHEFDKMSEADAMRAISQYTNDIKNEFSNLAIKYNINIITGSMPMYENGKLENVGFLCHRNGKIEKYEKIHITPDETKYWGMQGGDFIKTYQTDSGKIGILICYDVEFPELARILAEQGMQILFVPFLTDTQNAYMRVRTCAQARAVENECFVAITGSTGNLPQVDNLDVNYSQSVVFTPCDFAFPSNGIKSEATANVEMVLISDVDLKLLDELHNYGSVKNLKNRRKDFYSLIYLGENTESNSNE